MAWTALLATLVALTGGAQAPDDRAAARAFADAGLRFQEAAKALAPRFGALYDRPERACALRARRRSPEHRWDEINGLAGLQDDDRPAARLVDPVITRLSLELHGVATDDPALRGMRTVIRRFRRANAALAAVPAYDVCAEIRRYVDGGYEPTPALRLRERVLIAYDRAGEGDDSVRRLSRGAERMRELGIPESELEIWN